MKTFKMISSSEKIRDKELAKPVTAGFCCCCYALAQQYEEAINNQ